MITKAHFRFALTTAIDELQRQINQAHNRADFAYVRICLDEIALYQHLRRQIDNQPDDRFPLKIEVTLP